MQVHRFDGTARVVDRAGRALRVPDRQRENANELARQAAGFLGGAAFSVLQLATAQAGWVGRQSWWVWTLLGLVWTQAAAWFALRARVGDPVVTAVDRLRELRSQVPALLDEFERYGARAEDAGLVHWEAEARAVLRTIGAGQVDRLREQQHRGDLGGQYGSFEGYSFAAGLILLRDDYILGEIIDDVTSQGANETRRRRARLYLEGYALERTRDTQPGQWLGHDWIARLDRAAARVGRPRR